MIMNSRVCILCEKITGVYYSTGWRCIKLFLCVFEVFSSFVGIPVWNLKEFVLLFCQVIDLQLPANAPCPVSFNPDDNYYYVEDSLNVTGVDQMSVVGESEDKYSLQVLDGQEFYDPGQDGSDSCLVKNEHMAQPNDVNNRTPTNLLSSQDGSSAYLVKNEHMAQSNDLSNQAPVGLLDDLFSGIATPEDGLFLDAVDFLEPVKDQHDFDVLGSYLDDDFDIGPYLNFDSSPEQMGDDADQGFSLKQVATLLKCYSMLIEYHLQL